MKLKDTEIAQRYGISRSTYSGKSPEMRQQIREFVEAGGDKALEDALCLLQRQVYRASVSLKKSASVGIGSRLVFVNFSDNLKFTEQLFKCEKSAKEITLLATGEITKLIKAE